MPDLRTPLIPLSAVIGVVITSLAWLIFAGHSKALADLGRMEQRLAAPSPSLGRSTLAQDDSAGRILAAPLFALTTGPGAVGEVPVRLDGIAMTPTRKAALVSINGKPSVWLSVGATQDGVTLMEVQAAKVTLDTATGFKDVELGSASPSPPAGTAGAQAPAAPAAQPAYRLPPASAPNAH